MLSVTPYITPDVPAVAATSPGLRTFSERALLGWSPALYDRIYKIMLPGDYLAMRLTDEIKTTYTGLSEGIFWDYMRNDISEELLEYFGIDPGLLAEPVESFTLQGELTNKMAKELGLTAGIPVSYRAGSFSLTHASLEAVKFAGELRR